MVYTYNDFLPFVPDLRKYVRSKVKTDWWKDIVQDTMICLYMRFDKLIITDLKGLIFNTANWFISKHFRVSNVQYQENVDIKYMYSVSDSQNPVFKIGDWNSYKVDDALFANLRKVSKTLFQPFEMQMNDRTIKEIAHDLELNENTVKTRIKRCKEALRENL